MRQYSPKKLPSLPWLLLLFALGCSQPAVDARSSGGSAADDRLTVVCTTAQVADIVRNVAGQRVNVSSLMGAGDDPHDYLPNPREASQLKQAHIIFYNGLHLEGRMADMLEKMSSERPVYSVIEEVEQNQPELLRETTDFKGHYDPHIWFDASLWTHCVDYVAARLSEHAAAHGDEFRANAKAYNEKLLALHEECKQQMTTIDESRRVLVTAHDAFGYFGRAYDLEVEGLQGLSSADDASLGRINELVDMLVARKVKAIFIETSVPERHIRTVKDECKRNGHLVVIGGELFSDAMGNEGTPEGTYLGMMRHNINTILAALK